MNVTFRSLDRNVPLPGGAAESRLEVWYESVRDVPIDKFGAEDLCRAIRQDLFLEHVLPSALTLLEREPLAGALFDGELASCISRIPPAFWSRVPSLQERAKAQLQKVVLQADEDVSAEIKVFLE
jgi:hypothetical protein